MIICFNKLSHQVIQSVLPALASLVEGGVAEVHKASTTAGEAECDKQQCDWQHKQEDD